MVLTEYNEKEVMDDLAKESYKDGYDCGYDIGYDSGYDSGRQEEMANTEKERIRANIAEAKIKELESLLRKISDKQK